MKLNRRGFLGRLASGTAALLAAPLTRRVPAATVSIPAPAGFKGAAFMETGCVYAPYITLTMTLTSKPVTAAPIKLNTKWTAEIINVDRCYDETTTGIFTASLRHETRNWLPYLVQA